MSLIGVMVNKETPQNTSRGLDQPSLREWHKPTVEQITVSVDTGFLPGSAGDSEGGDLFFSDTRLKHDVAGFGNALQALLSLGGCQGPIGVAGGHSVPKASLYVPLIPIMVEAIKEQQRVLSSLQGEIAAIRRKSAV